MCKSCCHYSAYNAVPDNVTMKGFRHIHQGLLLRMPLECWKFKQSALGLRYRNVRTFVGRSGDIGGLRKFLTGALTLDAEDGSFASNVCNQIIGSF